MTDPKVTVLPGENMSRQLHQSPTAVGILIEPHLLTQTGDHHFQCDYCGKSLARKYDFMRHIHTHTGHCYDPDALQLKRIKARTPSTGVTTAAAATEAASSGQSGLGGIDWAGLVTSTRQCSRILLSIDQAVESISTASCCGHYHIGPLRLFACGCLLADFGSQERGARCSISSDCPTHFEWLPRTCLVTADPKLGVLCGENMSQQLHQSPLCNRSFTKKNCLEQHLLTQTDDHNYKCNDCGNIFSQTVALTDHPSTNSGGRPYKCDHCDSSFSQKGQLN
ncbi:uncharacterized protein LOC144109663 [Amblyomma americanum]